MNRGKISCINLVRPNRKLPVFRVTRPYLNLLLNPRIFSGFLEKIYNFMDFERQNASQNDYIFVHKKK